MGESLVSIVTPAWNDATYIAETARAVLAQTYANWEWIVVDDGSTDATREIVAGIADPRVRLIHSAHSGLPAVARNQGVIEARGAYIAYLDADDLWLPEKLALQMECFHAHPHAGLVFTQFNRLVDAGRRVQARSVPDLAGVPNPGLMFADLCFVNFICTSTVVVRRALLEARGLMDEDPAQRGTEDCELWLRLAPHAPFACVTRPLVRYRIHERGISSNAVAITKGQILAIEKAFRRNPDAPVDPRLAGARMEAWKHLWLGVAQWHDGSDAYGRRAFRASLRRMPSHWKTWIWLALSYLGPLMTTRFRRRLAA